MPPNGFVLQKPRRGVERRVADVLQRPQRLKCLVRVFDARTAGHQLVGDAPVLNQQDDFCGPAGIHRRTLEPEEIEEKAARAARFDVIGMEHKGGATFLRLDATLNRLRQMIERNAVARHEAFDHAEVGKYLDVRRGCRVEAELRQIRDARLAGNDRRVCTCDLIVGLEILVGRDFAFVRQEPKTTATHEQQHERHADDDSGSATSTATFAVFHLPQPNAKKPFTLSFL